MPLPLYSAMLTFTGVTRKDVDNIIRYGFDKRMVPNKSDGEEDSSDAETLTSESDYPRSHRRGKHSSDVGRDKGRTSHRSSHHAVSSRHNTPHDDRPERDAGFGGSSGQGSYGKHGYRDRWEDDPSGVN